MIRGVFANKKSFISAIIILVAIFSILKIRSPRDFYEAASEGSSVTVDDGGIIYKIRTEKESVGEFLSEQGITLGEKDVIMPSYEEMIFSGSKIKIFRAKKIVIEDDEGGREFYTLRETVEEALSEIDSLGLDENDMVEPLPASFVVEGMKIFITRVEIEHEIDEEKIDFKRISQEDDDLGWRVEKIKIKGEEGLERVTYEVLYHNGEEVDRKKVSSDIIKEPIDEVFVKGTYIDFGKTHTGFGTWYAQPKHLEQKYPSITGYYAANPWLPMGSYAKVTNKANGKSAIVRINDRGPFGENRIIDLGKNAFAAIASLGAGVIDVKMEEIKN